MAKLFRIAFLCACTLLVAPAALHAQQEVDERAMIEVQDGISISRDSLFLLNLRFRMQSRLGFTTVSGTDLSAAEVDARVRRLRLRLDGFVMSPRIRYYIQLAFTRADLGLDAGTVAQPVRDAMAYYHFSERFYIGFGQSKLPGNRQRVVSSGNLQFPDRSIANGRYTLDRDFGLFAYCTLPAGRQVFQLKGAFSTGDGRGMPPSSPGMAYTGRVEWLPLGAFINAGDYSEGDLEREPRPKLALGATYSHNEQAMRTGGQLGPALFAERDIGTFIADMALKYQGWALSGEYFARSSPRPVTTSLDGEVRAVQVGEGLNAQVSKYFSGRYELAARYTRLAPEAGVQGQIPFTEEALLGGTRYLNGHRIKLQLYAGYRWLERRMDLRSPGNAWTALFQVEFGI